MAYQTEEELPDELSVKLKGETLRKVFRVKKEEAGIETWNGAVDKILDEAGR